MKKVEAIQNNLNSGKSLRVNGHIDVEDRGPVLVARIDGGPQALFDAALVKQLKELVDRADSDPKVHAVVFTGTHPDRFLSHSDVRWLQQGGVGFMPAKSSGAELTSFPTLAGSKP